MSIFNRLNLSENTTKIVQNIGWAVLGKVVTLLGGFIVGVFVARYLGPEQYGLMNYVISYIAIFQVVAIFGLDAIEVREEAKNQEDRDVIVGTAFALKMVLALVTIVAVFITTLFSESNQYERWLIMIYSLSIVFNSFNVVRNYFTAVVWNEYVVKTEISRTLIGVAVKVGLLLAHAKLGWFIVAMLFDWVLLAAGYCASYSRRIATLKLWRFDKKWAKFLLRQSFPLMLSSAAVIVYQRIDQVMLKNMLDDAAVGQFSVASKFVEVLMFVPIMICQTVSPVLVKLRKESPSEYGEKSQIFMDVTIWISVVMSILLSAASYWLIKYTFGEEYMPAVPVLQVLAFKTVTVAISVTAGQLIVIEGIQDYAIFRDIIGCVFCVALNYYLIPEGGAVGSAWVAVGSNFVAGYFADLIIPKYRDLFHMQTQSLYFGWCNIFKIKTLQTF